MGVMGAMEQFSAGECQSRCRNLMRWLVRQGLDGAVIRTPVARLYYTGFNASNGILLLDAREGPVFLTDFRYLVAAKRQLSWLKCGDCGRGAAAKSVLARVTRRWYRGGYEGSVSVATHTSQQEVMGHIREWRDIGAAIAAQRAVKSSAELAAMRRAIRANDQLFREVFRGVRLGQSELEIAALVREAAYRLGDGEAFPAIVCAGANGAECHHTPDETRLFPGMPLLIDAGLKLGGYCSDLTRTVFYGEATSRFREVLELVKRANRYAINNLRPGMSGAEVDGLARNIIDQAGFGEAFGHSLGHALGLEVHELPAFAASCETVIRPGMVLTVEPGVYLPGEFGIRVEDVVLVTESGCEVLSALSN